MEQEPLLLDAKLEQLKESLRSSLAEVCRDDVGRLDTGQLVRIEEALVVARETAKEVVSIRRKRRRRASTKTPIKDVEVSVPAGAHRVFVDPRGTSWDVFAVLPVGGKALTRLPGPFQQGWLCFDAATEKRRLSPIPQGWETANDDELLRLRDQAIMVPPRTTPPEQHGSLQ
ncbi:MAG TPA: hypothetical protein VGG78_08615 [Gemmatimonadaceae bacterium]|jgi:hypothetical protein